MATSTRDFSQCTAENLNKKPDIITLTGINPAHHFFTAAGEVGDFGVYSWRLFFVTGKKSVAFDFRTSKNPIDDYIGCFHVLDKNEPKSTSIEPLMLDITPAPNLRVLDYVNFVLEQRLDKYKFNAKGSGCRFWCYTVIRLLEEAEYVQKGAISEVNKFFAEKIKQYPKLIPEPMIKGRFYARNDLV